MRIPKLFDWMNPTAPTWSHVDADEDEINALFEACVTLVGYDPRSDADDRYVVLGSGFLVSANGRLTILTAAHILTWWTDQVQPPKQHALRGVQGDREDVGKRLRLVLEKGYIAVAVARRAGRGDGVITGIEHISMNPRPADGDIAIIQVSLPQGAEPEDYRIFRIDIDPFDFREPVLIAGVMGGGRRIALDDTQFFGAAYWEQRITMRAGRVAEYVSDDAHPHRHMYRVSIPSLPGMSGGPLIAVRHTHNVVHPEIEATAVGVISSSGYAQSMLLDHGADEETWVTPIAHALGRKVNTQTGICTLSDAIKGGFIDAYGALARRVNVIRDPVTGSVRYEVGDDA